jgi:hypothetical protein
VYPNTRPEINIGDTIASVSGAFNQTKQGVLQRAMLQAQNARAQQESSIQAATAAQGGVMPTAVAHKYVTDYNTKNAPPETQASPSVLQVPPSPSVPGVGGLPSPGRILPINAPPQAPPNTQMAPASITPGGAPMQIQSGPIATPTGTPATGTGTIPSTGVTPESGGTQDWRHYFAKPSKLSVIDLPNGYSVIPELNPQYQQRMISEGRIAEMYGGRELTAGAHLQGIGMQQEGAGNREASRETSQKDLVDERGKLSLQQIAARGHTQMSIAQYRAGLKADPKDMTPLQRATLYQKIGQMYVGGANGDPDEAMATAQHDPHLKEFGVTPDQIQGYIGAAAMAVKQKQDAGDTKGALQLLGSYAAGTPEEAAAKVKQTHHAVAGEGGAAHGPPAGASDADAWEYYREHGMDAAAATAAVKKHHQGGGT